MASSQDINRQMEYEQETVSRLQQELGDIQQRYQSEIDAKQQEIDNHTGQVTRLRTELESVVKQEQQEQQRELQKEREKHEAAKKAAEEAARQAMDNAA